MSEASEYEFEPVRGLPELLPEGETMLWQGEPDTAALARRAFHVRAVAIYFGVLVAWRIAAGLADGDPLGAIAVASAWLAALGAAAVGVLVLLAWANARTTVYTITSRRIVMRFGIALPMTVNLPFRIVESAGLKEYADGAGDIPLAIVPGERVSYLLMWPYVRPWHISRPEPMLRGLRDARSAAQILAGALAAAAGQPAPRAIEARDEQAAAQRPVLPTTAAAVR
jgi:hypothetical protein